MTAGALPSCGWARRPPIRSRTLTVVLAHGQINLAGLVTDTKQGPGTFRLAITGGTGRYQSARGYATIVPSNSPKVTVHISA